ncbi:hypothetical protein [Lewinella sp. JB7]|uniref:hypothetical protein n=1 Tax=Lewinella sp. JB7 TaxID=2962887 RepID=UPI0020C97EBC|nr:hypothetical protein [Lewinella sp. JB7]MCP9237718.1 hypothetical protein [Lewinella sp. JB7]
MEKFPRLGFSLTAEEVERLKREGWINDDFSLNHASFDDSVDPIIKLLYAQAWKNGDVGKHRHIARGAAEANSTERNCASAFVYYQFGAHLGSGGAEPIVDQHVLRAFGIYRAGEDEIKIKKMLKLGQLRKSHVDLIDDYRAWMADDEDLCDSLRAEAGWRYGGDQVLFALGRAVR